MWAGGQWWACEVCASCISLIALVDFYVIYLKKSENTTECKGNTQLVLILLPHEMTAVTTVGYPYGCRSCSPSLGQITTWIFNLFKIFYLFIFRGRGGSERGRDTSMCERNIDQLPLSPPLTPGTWPTTQLCALTGNQTCNLSVCRTVFNPLSHTGQGFSILMFTSLPISVDLLNCFFKACYCLPFYGYPLV